MYLLSAASCAFNIYILFDYSYWIMNSKNFTVQEEHDCVGQLVNQFLGQGIAGGSYVYADKDLMFLPDLSYTPDANVFMSRLSAQMMPSGDMTISAIVQQYNLNFEADDETVVLFFTGAPDQSDANASTPFKSLPKTTIIPVTLGVQSMGMLREFTGWEQAQALTATSIKPDLLYFHFSIRQQLSNSFPESPIRLFAFPKEAPHKYWFMFKENRFIDPYCMLGHDSRTDFEQPEYLECLREFRVATMGALTASRPHLIIGRQYLIKAYSTVMRGLSTSLHHHEFFMHLFYMTPAQQRAVFDLEVRLHKGYVFDDVRPTIDGPFINATWRHAKSGDLEQTITKLQRLPSVCVRTTKTSTDNEEGNEPVAFEMCDPAGFFNNLFVVEEHRRRGLGMAVEARLAQKCVREKMCPYKTVEQSNHAVLKASIQSPHWTRWEEDDGRPAFVIFQHWETKE